MTTINSGFSTILSQNMGTTTHERARAKKAVVARAVAVAAPLPTAMPYRLLQEDVAAHIDRMNGTFTASHGGESRRSIGQFLMGGWLRICGTPKLPS